MGIIKQAMKPEKSRPLHLRPKRTAHALLRLVQVTDCHLYANPGRCLAGLNTLDTFDAILDLVKPSSAPVILSWQPATWFTMRAPLGYTRMRSRFRKSSTFQSTACRATMMFQR